MVYREYMDQVMSTASEHLGKGRSNESYLVTLPQDLLQGLYHYLGVSDRLALARTCKTLHNVHASSKLLQYRFTLDTSGFINVQPQSCDYLAAEATSSSSEISTGDSPSPGDIDKDEIAELDPYRYRSSGILFIDPPTGVKNPGKPVKAVNAFSSPLEKNLALRDRERRWEILSPAAVARFGVKGPAGVYELQEGIFLMCDEYSIHDLDGGRPTLIPLPSAQDPALTNPVIQPTSHKLSFAIADLTMDPAQDLIVVSEHRPANTGTNSFTPTHRYHLLSLSTFKPHPLAQLPTLDFPPATHTAGSTRQLLQVMGNTLVILVSRYQIHWLLAGLQGMPPLGSEEEIVCWNWKTGKVIARMWLPENGWFASFAMLSPTSFMVTSTSNISPVYTPDFTTSPASLFPPVIKIYSFLPDPDNNIDPVQPLSADAMDDTTPRPILLAQLDLPRFSPGAFIEGFDVRPDPAALPSKSPSLGNRSKAFTQDSYKGVMVFEIHVREPPDPMLDPRGNGLKVGFELFILREHLVNLAIKGEQRLSEQRIGRRSQLQGREFDYLPIEETIPWASWGEKNARFMDMSMRKRTWVCSCSGYRFVSLLPRPRPTGLGQPEDDEEEEENNHELVHSLPVTSDIQIYDFSPYNIRKPLYAENQDATITTHVEPSILSRRRIWANDVKTLLPFTEVVKKVGIKANGVMMDDQRVIAVSTRGRRNGDWTDIRQEMTVYCM